MKMQNMEEAREKESRKNSTEATCSHVRDPSSCAYSSSHLIHHVKRTALNEEQLRKACSVISN